MNAFAHAIAQQLGAPVPGVVTRLPMHQWRSVYAPKVVLPKKGTLPAAVLEHLQKHPDQDVLQIRAALDTDPYGRIYNAIQFLRRSNLIDSPTKVGNRIIWRVKV